MADDHEWKVATGRKAGRARKMPAARASVRTTSSMCASAAAPARIDALVARVQHLAQVISTSQFYQDLRAGVDQWLLATTSVDAERNVSEIVAYGIGCPSVSSVSQLQLACLLCLVSDLAPSMGAAAYEPAADMNDLALCERLGITNTTRNVECRHSATSGATLFYMPHCAHRMYSNVLWANWESERLVNVAIIGNSFLKYELSLRKKDASNCIALLSQDTCEIVLHDSMAAPKKKRTKAEQERVELKGEEKVYAAFTDTSVMYYSIEVIKKIVQSRVLHIVPPRIPLGEVSTVWDQEMVFCE
jgi:hypothetical protein|tara:strand:- start:241 stop:1149 length:909 start_codon:yes stop_codon:yes gene_type:complete